MRSEPTAELERRIRGRALADDGFLATFAIDDAAARSAGREKEGRDERVLAIATALGRLGTTADDAIIPARVLDGVDRRVLIEEAAMAELLLKDRLRPGWGTTWRERRAARRDLRRVQRAVGAPLFGDNP